MTLNSSNTTTIHNIHFQLFFVSLTVKMPFSAEQHYESKIRQGSIRGQSTILHFDRKPLECRKREQEKGIRRVCRDRFRFEDFVSLNSLHTDYLKELKGDLGSKAFLDVIYKAELTGARVRIAGREGIVVEERKNSLCVIFESNEVKIYPKRNWDFTVLFDGVEYIFISRNLRANRLTN